MIRYRTLKRDFEILKLVSEYNLAYKEIARKLTITTDVVKATVSRYKKNKKFYVDQFITFFHHSSPDIFKRLP